MCEVENRNVLDLPDAAVNTPLPNRNYNIVHADTSDARGIDVAFIYDDDLFDAPPAEVLERRGSSSGQTTASASQQA